MALNVVTKTIRSCESLSLLYKNFGKSVLQTSTRISVQNARHNSYLLKHCKFTNPALSTYSSRFYSVKSEPCDNEKQVTDANVTIIGDNIPKPYTDLQECDFPQYIKDYLTKEGFTKPTLIQSHAWPIAIQGRNFVGVAQTGTGKTLAFLLPAVLHIKNTPPMKGSGPRALVLAPTRELARQIEQVAKDFKHLWGIKTVCIYGGASRNIQAGQLNDGVDIVIATPGRLNDFLESRTTNLGRCTYVVLDEADRMLDMGFEPQIRQALEGVPADRQILMFSATWPKEVQGLAQDYLGKFVQVNVGSTELSANHNITQHMYLCDDEMKNDKFRAIMHQIAADGYGKVLVFANTKRSVDRLAMALRRNGWRADGIHGDRTQMQRDSTIRRFKDGNVKILVATDVAARGLDVDGVTHVINYDFPNTTEDYIHRIGRTGRSESKGESHTLLTSEDERHAADLIAIMMEAKQDIPKDLEDMVRSFRMSKNKSQAPKYNRFQQKGWNPNRRFNKFKEYNRY